jgi:hypothetical protein
MRSISPIQLENQAKEVKRDRACSTHGREEEYIENAGRKARRKEFTRKT